MQWAPNLCRVCGLVSETCHVINQKNEEIKQKLKKCLNIEVNREDQKPKQICNGCLLKVNDFYEFTLICDATNAKFENIYTSKHQWPPNDVGNYTHSHHPQQKISVIVTSKPSESLGCPEIDLYKDNILTPLENITVPSCQLNDQSLIGIVENNENYSNPIQENISHFITPQSYDKIYTNECYNQNNVVHHSQPYQIPPLSTDSVPDVNYEYHEKQLQLQESNKETNFFYKYNNLGCAESCSSVGVDFTTYHSKDKHIDADKELEQAVEEVKKLAKSDRDKKLISIDTLRDYVKYESSCGSLMPKTKSTDKKLFECSQCDKKFMRKVTLKAHMAIHTKLRPYLCDICKKYFAVKCDLTNHQRLHTEDYKCKQCSKTFPVPSKLQRHMRTHTNHRPFVCPYKNCGRAFSDKRNLDSHKYTHIDERNYKCPTCGKKYKTKNRLKEHSKAHSDKPQYKCEICGKEYKWKANLANHRRKHTGYICPYCNKDCGKASKFYKHRKECAARYSDY